MLDAEQVLALTGHPVGGVCPFGLATPLPVYCDISLRAFDDVIPAAGGLHTAVRIAPRAAGGARGRELGGRLPGRRSGRAAVSSTSLQRMRREPERHASGGDASIQPHRRQPLLAVPRPQGGDGQGHAAALGRRAGRHRRRQRGGADGGAHVPGRCAADSASSRRR